MKKVAFVVLEVTTSQENQYPKYWSEKFFCIGIDVPLTGF